MIGASTKRVANVRVYFNGEPLFTAKTNEQKSKCRPSGLTLKFGQWQSNRDEPARNNMMF